MDGIKLKGKWQCGCRETIEKEKKIRHQTPNSYITVHLFYVTRSRGASNVHAARILSHPPACARQDITLREAHICFDTSRSAQSHRWWLLLWSSDTPSINPTVKLGYRHQNLNTALYIITQVASVNILRFYNCAIRFQYCVKKNEQKKKHANQPPLWCHKGHWSTSPVNDDTLNLCWGAVVQALFFLCFLICISSDKDLVLVGGFQQWAKYSANFFGGGVHFLFNI